MFVEKSCISIDTESFLGGRIAQSVTCLATDASLTADPGVASSIPARSYTFVEIDHEIISTVILLLPLNHLTLKAPITTAADGKFWNIFPNFRQK